VRAGRRLELVNLRLARTVAVLLAVALGMLMPVSSALAHTDVVSTVPDAGAVLDAAPGSVTFTFNEELLAASVEASILDSAGALISSVTPEVDGTVVTIPWPEGLPAGGYEVAYRVASGDGHPVTGSVEFRYASGSAVPSEPGMPSESALAPPVGATPFAPAPDPAESTPAAADAGGMAINPFFVVILLVVAAVVGGVIAVRRSRR
jgi:methionine-rich copper-binding protein CopC